MITVILKIKDVEVQLTLDELRALKKELDELLEKEYIPYPQPIVPISPLAPKDPITPYIYTEPKPKPYMTYIFIQPYMIDMFMQPDMLYYSSSFISTDGSLPNYVVH